MEYTNNVPWQTFIDNIAANIESQRDDYDDMTVYNYFLNNTQLQTVYENTHIMATDELASFIFTTWQKLLDIISERESAMRRARNQKDACEKLYIEVEQLFDKEKSEIKSELEVESNLKLQKNHVKYRELKQDRDVIQRELETVSDKLRRHEQACIDLNQANAVLQNGMERIMMEREDLELQLSQSIDNLHFMEKYSSQLENLVKNPSQLQSQADLQILSLEDQLGTIKSSLQQQLIKSRRLINCETISSIDPPQTPDRVYKIILLGNSNTGKTSIISRYTHDVFSEHTQSTIDISYSMKTQVVYKKKVRSYMSLSKSETMFSLCNDENTYWEEEEYDNSLNSNTQVDTIGTYVTLQIWDTESVQKKLKKMLSARLELATLRL